jgi:ankyrin repeat protein
MSGRQFVPTLKNRTLKLIQSQQRKNEYLIFHVINGDILQVQSSLFRGANPNHIGVHGGTPLGIACVRGDLEMVRLLVDSGSNVNYLNGRGDYPLSVACANGHLEIAQFLLHNGANVSYPTGGTTPLMMACGFEGGNLELARLLLDSGANVNDVITEGNFKGMTPLMWACRRGQDVEIVRLLLDRGARVNDTTTGANKGYTALMWACHRNAPTAALGGRDTYLEIVRLLLDHGADLNVREAEGSIRLDALMIACQRMHTEIVRLLLDRGANPNAVYFPWSSSPLLEACLQGDIETSRLLLSRGANVNFQITLGVNAQGRTGDPGDIRPHVGLTPLMAASHADNLELVKLLVNAGANVNVVDSRGFTAEEHARRLGRAEIVQYFEGLRRIRRGEFPVQREGENPISIMAGPAALGSLGANDPSRVEGSLGGTGPVEDEMGESDPSRVATPRTRKGGYYRRKTYKKCGSRR